MRRLTFAGGLLVAGFLILPAAAVAQNAPPPPQQDSVELKAEREIFAYPSFERRNPFKPLTAAEGGPRFEMMRLQGIIYSREPGRSVATLTAGGGSRTTQAAVSMVAAYALKISLPEMPCGYSRRVAAHSSPKKMKTLIVSRV